MLAQRKKDVAQSRKEKAGKENMLPVCQPVLKIPKAKVQNESTRHRWQARTGLPGDGQNKSFSYGKCASQEEYQDSYEQGKAWVRKRWEDQKLPLHELPF